MGNKIFKIKFLEYDKPTCLGHLYSRKILENAIVKYCDKIKQGIALGPLQNGELILRDVSFRVLAIDLEDSGAFVTLEILPNENGKNLEKMLINDVAKIAISGFGKVSPGGHICSEYELFGFAIDLEIK